MRDLLPVYPSYSHPYSDIYVIIHALNRVRVFSLMSSADSDKWNIDVRIFIIFFLWDRFCLKEKTGIFNRKSTDKQYSNAVCT